MSGVRVYILLLRSAATGSQPGKKGCVLVVSQTPYGDYDDRSFFQRAFLAASGVIKSIGPRQIVSSATEPFHIPQIHRNGEVV